MPAQPGAEFRHRSSTSVSSNRSIGGRLAVDERGSVAAACGDGRVGTRLAAQKCGSVPAYDRMGPTVRGLELSPWVNSGKAQDEAGDCSRIGFVPGGIQQSAVAVALVLTENGGHNDQVVWRVAMDGDA